MKMQAGTYYIGDLCYVMHDRWGEFCDATIDGTSVKDGVFVLLDGCVVASFTTAYGDGTYEDFAGNSYPVDAGLIGCIKMSDIAESERGNVEGCGNMFTFEDDFEVGSRDGVITFGGVTIDTN